jgi:hypothetical protein
MPKINPFETSGRIQKGRLKTESQESGFQTTF